MDSQEERSHFQSQDLFVDNVSDNVGRQILAQLQKMDKRLDAMSKDISKLKSSIPTSNSFTMMACSFKRKLLIFLKNMFTKKPWLNQQADMEFKTEIRRLLKKEGFNNDSDAYRTVVQWATSKFTDLRNQLRRKIIQEITAGNSIMAMTVEEFCKKFLGPFISASEDVTSEDRVRLCLVLRSFIHKKKIGDGNECIDFWGSFHSFYGQVLDSEEERKWERLASIDQRRVNKQIEASENQSSEM
ncbi:uncharacterized protein [Argopecten irradians]|uniref:uncharacterized protein n=1 Tax=Argopecten irradians TaxID=31199 RepID=UPI00371294E8